MIPSFKSPKLLKTALTHRSVTPQHNERLEFLGDAVLELIVSNYLFLQFPQYPEGRLTRLRSSLVCTINLAKVAKKLKIKPQINPSTPITSSILANTVEAVIGAIYLDQGIDIAKNFIYTNILPSLNQIIAQKLFIDPKSLLQEKIQAQKKPTPVYKVIKTIGPDHNKIFTVEVIINKKSITQGTGKSLKSAETAAAKAALKELV